MKNSRYTPTYTDTKTHTEPSNLPKKRIVKANKSRAVVHVYVYMRVLGGMPSVLLRTLHQLLPAISSD